MIYYVVSAGETKDFKFFLKSCTPQLAGRVEIVPYWRLAVKGSLSPGTYIFSQIEILPPDVAREVAEICDGIEKLPGFRLLNHPRRSLRRYELLSRLHAAGLNAFRVYSLGECRMPDRFPVFIRGENDHRGSQTVLLRTPEEFRRAAAAFGSRRHSDERDMVVEFCDTADSSGQYRKYGAVIVGDRVMPRHLFFGRHWMIKTVNKEVHPETLEEERQFMDRNPHESQVREVFRLAGIQFGRIDYSVLNGRIQTWEINTHPQLIGPTDYTQHPERACVQDRFRELVIPAFEGIDMDEAGEPYRIGSARRIGFTAIVLSARLRRKRYVLERRSLRQRLKAAGVYMDLKQVSVMP